MDKEHRVGSTEVLVVVPTLGTRPDWLRECVTSIRSQEGVSPIIRIVCPSGTVTLKEFSASRVEIIEYDQRGLAAAIREGFANYEGEFITWLGDDDKLQPGSLQAVVEALKSSPQASFAYGRTRYIAASGSTIGVTRPGRLAAHYLTVGKDFVPQPGSVIRRSAYEAVGGIDVDLANAMDLDLFIRLQRYGASVYVPRELSCYRLHESSITVTKGDKDEGELVRLKYLSKTLRSSYRIWRPVTRIVDRVWDVSNRRLPSPSAPR